MDLNKIQGSFFIEDEPWVKFFQLEFDPALLEYIMLLKILYIHIY